MYDLCLIDAKNLVYRCDWTCRDLKNKKEEKIGILYGVLNSLQSLKKMYQIKKFYFLWDSLSNWRVNLFSWYKKGRVDSPGEDFINQMSILRTKFLQYVGIDQFEAETFEADDIAAWIVDNRDGKKLLVTNDHDWLQLVGENCDLLRPCKKMIFNTKSVIEVEGLSPIKLPLYWSLIGDESDNIKGIPKIRKKTAMDLVHGITGIEDLLNNLYSCNQTVDWKKRVERNYNLICLRRSSICNIVGQRSVWNKNIFKEMCELYGLSYLRFISLCGM